jgi:Ca-activated chloride channel homolog
MSTATKRVPLIDLPIGKTRELGTLQVQRQGTKRALPLAGVDISAQVADRVASVTVKQTFKNDYAEHLEAVYIFPLSGGCVVSDFEMRVGTRVVKGEVQERAKARIEYQNAIQAGKRAALLEQERDDVFTMNVGNIPPDEEITITVTYSERLSFFESGRTELRLPLVVAPRFIPGEELDRKSVGSGTEGDTDLVPDASRISPPRLVPGFDPQVALKIAVDLSLTDDSGSTGVSDLSCSQHATQLGLADGSVHVELAREDERLDRDFVLQWRLATGAVRSSMLVYKGSDNTSYGMLSITPPKRDGYVAAPRDIVFVLDRSGSMAGIKMTSAARACSFLLSTLGPDDRFAIQAFDDSVEWLTQPNASGWDSRWVSADEAGIERGEKFLRSIDARGGTMLGMALTEAMTAITNRRMTSGRIPVMVVLTDGEVGNEADILRLIQQKLGESRLFAIGIDTAVNSGLLRRLANLGGGTATFVQPGTALENALRSVGREIGTPMITDLEIVSDSSFAPAVDSKSLAPSRIPDLFEGRGVTAFVKLTGKGTVVVRGTWADGKKFSEKVRTRKVDVPAVAQLWAKATLTDLEDQFRVSPNDSIRKQIIELSIKHSVLTKLTAFVAVDHAEVTNNDGTLRTIVQAVENPAHWDMLNNTAAGNIAGAGVRYKAASVGMTGGWGSPVPQQAESQDMRCQESGAGAPVNAFSQSPAPPGAPSAGRSSYSGFAKTDADALDRLGDSLGASLPARPSSNLMGHLRRLRSDDAPNAPDALRKAKLEPDHGGPVSEALATFADLLTRLFTALGAGTMLSANDITALEKARKALFDALNCAPVGMKVPLLQKFLRGAAVELIESGKQPNGTAAGLHSIWDRHMQAFHEAQAEATTQLSATGSDVRFWEASV